MKVLKTVLLAGAATLIMAASAAAADLPTKKGAPLAPAPVNCYADFWTWLNASPADCPLGEAGIALYGQIDVGASYETNGARLGDSNKYPDYIEDVIGAQGHGSKFQIVDNQLSPSNVGIKATEHLFGDVSLIADWRIAFNPVSLQLLDGPGSLINNNGIATQLRSPAASSAYNGAFDNNRAFVGFQSPTLGTFKFGRVPTFYNDLEGAYDATGGAYGFSALGYSGTWSSGFGITETNRMNLGASYLYDYNKLFHVGAQTALGEWSVGNDAKYQFGFDAGATYQGFSFDGIYQHATDAIHLGAYSAPTAGVNLAQDLTATLANQDAFALMAKYNYQAFTIYGIYSYARLTNPTDTLYPNGFENVVGSAYTVLGTGVTGSKISTTAYTIPEDLQALQISGKYSINPQFDVMATYAYIWQNDYDTAPGAGLPGQNCSAFNSKAQTYTGVGTIKGDCSGATDVGSILLDYRPVKRVDVYGGVIYSVGSGGMVSGYWATNNTAVTAGVRLSF
ncbi:MAG: porin [Roseiarcus sp.]